jgi:uncharacterized protein
MAAFSVSAHDIDTAGLTVDAELPVPWLDEELRDAHATARAPGRVAVRLSRSGKDIVVRGRVRAAITVPCARCLDPAAIDVDTELSLLLQPVSSVSPADHGHKAADKKAADKKAADKEEEHEFSAGEADLDTYDGETVALGDFVREAILLEVPNFPLCSEGCPGIRPAAEPTPGDASEPAGHLDPRLAPLAALREKLKAPGEPPKPKSAVPPRKKNKE